MEQTVGKSAFLFRPCEDFNAILGDSQSVFHVHAGHAIAGNHGPVIVQHACVFPTHVDHWLNSQDQAFFQAEILSFHAFVDKVGDLGILVHDAPNAVTDILEAASK